MRKIKGRQNRAKESTLKYTKRSKISLYLTAFGASAGGLAFKTSTTRVGILPATHAVTQIVWHAHGIYFQ